MKTAPVMRRTPVLGMAVLAFSFIALSSSSLIAQQPAQTQPQPPTTPVPDAQGAPAANTGSGQTGNPDATNTSAAPIEMRPVNGELVGKLDSKSAKAGDQVVVKTSEAVKTADGTVIPKGSKLVGHVSKVQSHSQGSENSAVAIAFDRAELKGGQNVTIASVIKSVAPAPGDMASNAPDPTASPMSGGAPSGGGMAGHPGSGATPSNAGSTANTVTPSSRNPSTNGSASGTSSAGTIVGKTGDDPIRTTAIPGVFLASTTASEASTMSGTLFASKSEVHLNSGTQVGLEVATAVSR
jgi:hypothetical protein